MSYSAHVDDGDYPRRLRGFAAQMMDLRPFWPIAARFGRQWFKEQLDSEGKWGGDPWEPLSPDYAAWKAQHYPGRPMLWREGALRAAAFNPARKVTAQTLTLTVTDPKVGFHQEGTVKMPRRPIIPDEIPDHAMDQLRDAFDKWTEEVIRRWGLDRH